MQEFIPIDPQTASKLRITPEEAKAVVEMWTFHQRLSDPNASHYVSYAPPPGSTISNSDVRSYLNQIRAMRKRGLRAPRPKSADVRLAMFAVAGFALVVFSATAFFSSQRRNSYPAYDYYSPRSFAPTPVAAIESTSGVSRTIEGFSSFQNNGNRVSEMLAQQSMRPSRMVYSLGRTVFVAAPHMTLSRQIRSISYHLRQVVGGPVAARSRVPNRPVTIAEATAALRSTPTEAVVPVAFESGTPAPSTPESALVEWQTIRLAFNGKVTEANVPFARVSDPGLMAEVEQEQEQIIAKLVAIGMKLTGGDGTAPR